MERKRELKRLKAFLFETWSCVSERKTLYAEVHVQKKKKKNKKHRVELTVVYNIRIQWSLQARGWEKKGKI